MYATSLGTALRGEKALNHSEHSSFREKLVEHLFIGELLKLSWKEFGCTLEVASPEVDNAGYDLIAEDNGVVRHIQLKASYVGGKTASQKVHTRLSEKPSVCYLDLFQRRYLGAGAIPLLWLSSRREIT
ncbi:hypothetical protein [Halomonas sp. PA16-9]|uniref:hypothetical protein n=1 Tax=Halomonas sp. PA16-9 TaxID=2576841 RepID=UPI0030EB23C7